MIERKARALGESDESNTLGGNSARRTLLYEQLDHGVRGVDASGVLMNRCEERVRIPRVSRGFGRETEQARGGEFIVQRKNVLRGGAASMQIDRCGHR